ncbi:Beta-Casp domain [Macleaya cordata]|uniref:Beta-Casp domain n=1 Tax=Macleaya cordata TaxID=56857 RepID=A0A200QA16_MACCD|nr:Beta-Casp domain [Macleaya cordata]
MKLTCLSKGSGFHFPPCYIFTLCEFKILLDCPIDLSALTIFSPIPTGGSYQAADFHVSDISMEDSCISDSNEPKRRKIEKTLQASDLIHAEPWYKTVTNLSLWDISFIDFVLISSPMGMLGLPFLTRNNKFSAKIYATEATARLGKLMMEDLVSMQMEFKQYYGSQESDFPQWMRWDKLELLPVALRKIVMGEDGADLASWQPLYSAENVKDCLQKVQTLKYAEETCCNGTFMIKAFSSGLEIGTSNWTISCPRRSIVCLSSSIFESAHAMNFDYRSLQGNDVILFSDLSLLHGAIKDAYGNRSLPTSQAQPAYDFSALREGNNNEEEFIKSLVNADESLEEMDKLAFICSHAIDSIKAGGSVLVPFGRLGIVLQLLEQISLSLESSNLKVPIFIVSTVAEEMLAFTNVVPEWLCRQRQQKLYSGEALFGHVELIKSKNLHLFPAIHSPEFLMMWQEPCIVFCPHWSLRLGPVVHFLRRWSGDHNSLLVLEQGVDADLALLPFQPVAMKVFQCSFLSGIKVEKVQPLLKMLQPKLVLFPEDLRLQIPCPSTNSFSFLHYSLNKTMRVPRLRNDYEANLATDLAFQLEPRRTNQENMAIARLRGKLFVDNGRYVLVSAKDPIDTSERSILMHWGSPDPSLLLVALREKGIHGSIDRDRSVLEIYEPNKALIEFHSTHTVVSTDEKLLATLIFEAIGSVLDGI